MLFGAANALRFGVIMGMMMVAMVIVVVITMIVAVIVIRSQADAAHVMMMPGLGFALILLIADHLLAIFAELAIHQVLTLGDLVQPVDESFQHQRVVVEIFRLEEGDSGVGGGDRIGLGIDTLHQHAGEQEIREYDDARKAELDRMFKAFADSGVGDAAIGGFGPAKPHAFPQHPGDLRNIGIRVRVIGSAADHEKEGLIAGDC